MEKSERHFMYIVLCKDRSFYTGYTTNLERRMQQHNNGTGAKYTRARRPVRLLFAQEFASKTLAMRAEALFKKQSRIEKEQFLAQQHVRLDFSSKAPPHVTYLIANEEENV